MIRSGHLSVYDVTLTTQSPLHIGNGRKLSKTDYLLNKSRSVIAVVNADELITFLCENGFVEQYERFILNGNQSLRDFLMRECGQTEAALQRFCLYEVSTADALDAQHPLKEIRQFVRNQKNQVYVPGSSLKGALRTALLLAPIQKAQPWGNSLHKKSFIPEKDYLNTLQYLNDRKGKTHGNAVTSIMQGIRISDSQVIDRADLTLSTKVDVFVNGSTNYVNVCRECIRPGIQIHFTLTLDHSILDHASLDGQSPITIDTIRTAIVNFSEYYSRQYVSLFQKPIDSVDMSYQNALILGGGAGFFSKSLAYPYWKDHALKYVSQYMMDTFPKHGHNLDWENQVSPHMMKYARYQGKLYPVGVCGVRFQ